MTTTPSGAEPVITTEGLGKRFGDVVAVDGIDLAVPAGTVLGMLGPNGAGKTTTIRILTTILVPDAGRASVLGIDVAKQPQAVRERIGLAGQFAAVDENLTGRENLRMVGMLTHLPKAVVRERTIQILDQFDLTDAADRPVKTYSGGMRRRLDLGAALLHRPPVLFLDEPTTGLDPQSRNDLWTVIQGLVDDGTTVLLTTQYLEEADRLADNIIVIDRGHKIAEGSAAELKARLGATIVEVTFGDPASAQRAVPVAQQVGSCDVESDGRTMMVKVNDSGKSVLQLVRALDSSDVVPDALAVREPTLDDVFLSLTGHRAEEEDEHADHRLDLSDADEQARLDQRNRSLT